MDKEVACPKHREAGGRIFRFRCLCWLRWLALVASIDGRWRKLWWPCHAWLLVLDSLGTLILPLWLARCHSSQSFLF